MGDKIYIPEEDEYGEIVNHGAYASLIKYHINGVLYEVVMPNDEFEIVGEEE